MSYDQVPIIRLLQYITALNLVLLCNNITQNMLFSHSASDSVLQKIALVCSNLGILYDIPRISYIKTHNLNIASEFLSA